MRIEFQSLKLVELWGLREKLDHGGFCRSRSPQGKLSLSKETTSKLQETIGDRMCVVGMKEEDVCRSDNGLYITRFWTKHVENGVFRSTRTDYRALHTHIQLVANSLL